MILDDKQRELTLHAKRLLETDGTLDQAAVDRATQTLSKEGLPASANLFNQEMRSLAQSLSDDQWVDLFASSGLGVVPLSNKQMSQLRGGDSGELTGALKEAGYGTWETIFIQWYRS